MRFELRMSSLLTDVVEKELKVATKLLPIKSEELKNYMTKIPKGIYKNTLILDMDETMIHTLQTNISDSKLAEIGGRIIKVTSDNNGNSVPIQILIRPGLKDFLNNVSAMFNLIVIQLHRYLLLPNNFMLTLY